MVNSIWSKNKELMVDATIYTTILMCLGIGFTCPAMLHLCGVRMGVDEPDGVLADDSSVTMRMWNAIDRGLRFVLVRRKEKA